MSSSRLDVAITSIGDTNTKGGQFKEVFLHSNDRRSLSFNVADPEVLSACYRSTFTVFSFSTFDFFIDSFVIIDFN
jgi:hypothetical protein